MKKITLFFLLVICEILSAQQFEWLQTPEFSATGNFDGTGYSVATDAAGNVYMAGFRDQQFNYTEVFGVVGYQKYTSSGQLIWSKTIGGKAMVYSIDSDADGNLLMAAGYVNSLSIGEFGLITINQGVQFVALKFDPQGNLLWHMPIAGGDSSMHDFRAITTDDSSNIYLGYDNYNNSWIQKLSPAGEILFTITQTGAPVISSIDVDATGNIYSAGSCANISTAFAGVSAPTTFSYSTYVVKYDSSGAYQWHQYVEDITCSLPRVVAHNADQIYFSSQLFGSYDFGGLTAEGPAGGGFSDFFLAKLNGSGQFQWMREVPGQGYVETGHRNFIDTDADGNIYYIGSGRGTINWGNSIITTTPSWQNMGLLLRYDPNGTIVSAITFGSAQDDRCDAIVVNSDGAYITGLCNGASQFGTIVHTPGQQRFPFLTKVTGFPLGVPDNSELQQVLYPNPSVGTINYSSVKTSNAEIYNLQGRMIHEMRIGGGVSADISHLAEGVYIIAIGDHKLRLIKNK